MEALFVCIISTSLQARIKAVFVNKTELKVLNQATDVVLVMIIVKYL